MDNLVYDNIEDDNEFKAKLKTINNNNTFLVPQKNDNDIKYKYLKLWVIVIILITVMYFTYWCINYDSHPVAYYDKNRLDFLRRNTGAHPPPLFNFMDVPDVFNNKYIS